MNLFTLNNGLCDMTLMYSKNKKKIPSDINELCI